MRRTLAFAAAALLSPTVALGQAPSGAPPAPAAPGAAPVKPPPPPISKAPPACGVKVLPLVVGNEWTYTPITAPAAAPEAIARVAPNEPKSIVITVTAIDKAATDTVVSLDEKITIDLNKDPAKPPVLDDHVIKTTITCGPKKFEISPDSFFFAAEPGGFYNLVIDKVERSKGTSWQITNGGIGEAEWREDIVAHWTRTPTAKSDAKLGGGKLELERRFTPQQPETVKTKLADWKAEKLGLITTGRVTLEGALAKDPKPMELPAGWVSQLWLAENVGVIQTLNSYAHMYQLSDAKLK
jgi:hypothetical protein